MSVYTEIVPIYGHLADFLNLPKYKMSIYTDCLLYTSDAADEEDSVDLGGRRIIKKKITSYIYSRFIYYFRIYGHCPYIRTFGKFI